MLPAWYKNKQLEKAQKITIGDLKTPRKNQLQDKPTMAQPLF